MPSPTHNRHHLYWPRKQYKTALERAFRNLPCNVQVLEIAVHNDLHRTTAPPRKPSGPVMREAVTAHRQRRCPSCHPSPEEE